MIRLDGAVAIAVLLLVPISGLWWFRYVPVDSPVPGIRLVWDRLGHRHCYSRVIPPQDLRVRFDQAWEATGPGWSITELRCD